MLDITYSNRIENLYQQLKINLFSSSSPFCRRLIIVPTPAIKSWLMLQMAQDPDLGIAAGIEIHYLENAIHKLIIPSKNHHPTRLELTLAVDAHIRQIHVSWNELNDEQKSIWQPLFNYLKIQPNNALSRRADKRLANLAESLAKIFIEYSKYGQAMIESWPNERRHDWQQQVWQHLFSTRNTTWMLPAFEYKTAEFIQIDIQVHLFSISFLSTSEQAFLNNASQTISTRYYLLSPCYSFWTDLLSDKEASALQKFWKKQDAPIDEQHQLEDYLRDKNPLLANWGKLGRKMTEGFESLNLTTQEHYQLPAASFTMDAYRDLLTDSLAHDTSTFFTLLSGVQSDILLLRNPDNTGKIAIDKDSSIQLHAAPSKQREIQILYHNLLHLIKESQNDIFPADIIVMAPDIIEYAPFIRYYFGAESSQLNFQLMDMRTTAEDLLTQQFLHLMGIPFRRWDVADILFLLNFPNLQKKFQLEKTDIQQIQEWLEDSGILWGETSHHRDELLKLRYSKGMADPSKRGTWDEGFSKLLSSLIKSEGITNIEFSQSLLLGKLIAFLNSLKEDLKPFSSFNERAYNDWSQLLQKLIAKYLSDETESELFKILDEITLASRWIPEQKISFTAYKKHLESNLNQQTQIYRENHLHTVRFCSMLPMRAIPAKVIALIGLEESAFPRIEKPHSLNKMIDSPLCDYRPTRTDFDRYLFLEALLSARQHLLLSYPKYAQDSKEQAPSLLVTELFQYIDSAFECEGTSLSAALTFNHPYHAFDAQYFNQSLGYNNYSTQDYKLALSRHEKNKKAAHQFIHDFAPNATLPSISNEIVISIQQLKTAIQNPFKSYFNQTLGIWIKEEQELQTEENFEITPLQMHSLRKASVKNSLPEILTFAEDEGYLPLGLFKTNAKQKIQKEIEKYHTNIQALGLDKSTFFNIELNEQYQAVTQEIDTWKIPAITFDYTDDITIKIIGKIEDVAPSGLVAHLDQSSEPIKMWVEYILLNYLIDQHKLPIQKQLLCTKNAKTKNLIIDDSKKELRNLIDYYFYTLTNISPLSNEWLEDLMQKSPDEFEKSMHTRLNDTFNPMYNEYIKWACRSAIPHSHGLIQHWQPKAKELFSDLYSQWNAKEKK